jgi:hypothetical protein
MSNYKKLYKECWEKWNRTDGEGNEYISCVDCATRIYEQNVSVNNFAHVKSKGSCPEMKYEVTNVVPKCTFCHSSEHISGKFHNYSGYK